ncbi:uncharacterized protein ColSpa_06490 [Colletotrichum spaethianum]|uniref:Uncharacterized protein n=1 Tax=Colletotrichum spaethianum TaxID=700344 RepID=A0AA37P7Y3_9PEZI|nr:uncharacterized protein ColSpa_06490 [Colletotrichum spaethianum]GKT46309.1 hypothetical protein ColSpa_06490 [Colletotrichum spaethianum]
MPRLATATDERRMVGGCDIRVEDWDMVALGVFGDDGWTPAPRQRGPVRVGLGAGVVRQLPPGEVVLGGKRYVERLDFGALCLADRSVFSLPRASYERRVNADDCSVRTPCKFVRQPIAPLLKLDIIMIYR